jgi:hypothetical protein
MQSKKNSAIEIATNVGSGYFLSVILTFFMFPLFGITVPIGSSMIITAIFTVASYIRGYAIRRIFNKYFNN